MNPQLKLALELANLAAKCDGKAQYSNEGIAIMNIQFDLVWEEIFGFLP